MLADSNGTTAMAMAMAMATATATAVVTVMMTVTVTVTATAMAIMMAGAKVMARLMVMRTGMGGRWEAAACGHCLLEVSGSDNKEEDSELAMITNRAMEMLQQRSNQPACER